jgi:hypothetical protein
VQDGVQTTRLGWELQAAAAAKATSNKTGKQLHLLMPRDKKSKAVNF